MLLAIDIGNSSVKFGAFENEVLQRKFSIPTVQTLTADEIYSRIFPQIPSEISAVIVSSVVPELKSSFQELFTEKFGVEPIFVDSSFDFGLENKYVPPENLGVDRIIAAFAAVKKYGKPCVVCDFGTATTIDAINSKTEYLGGIITPGINTLSEALFLKTAKLPRVEIRQPEKIIGNSTVSSIQSGIFYGYIGLVEGILRRMIKELNETTRVVATGGFAALIAESCPIIETIDENLLLDGLRLIYQNAKR
jgi:type III pantothenate kinase